MTETEGGATKAAHATKILRDIESGRIPRGMYSEQDLQDLRKDMETLNYSPPPLLHRAYMTFQEVRRTKAYESPINHADLHYYCQLLGLRLQRYQVTAILHLDGTFYRVNEKLRSKKK